MAATLQAREARPVIPGAVVGSRPTSSPRSLGSVTPRHVADGPEMPDLRDMLSGMNPNGMFRRQRHLLPCSEPPEQPVADDFQRRRR